MKRGRRSSASLSVIASQVGVSQRIKPPSYLSEAESCVWIETVNDQPAGAFTITHAPLLEMYCRHVANGRVISNKLLNFEQSWLDDDEGLKRYDTLLKLAERESRAASSLATRLRITRQAVHNETVARSIANNSKSKKPWQMLTHEVES